ncbi:MAG TPA: uracil-DNA glycosylase [Pirellulales bacterium]|jgi:DNA polymerase|nr:uracil-DNA glycosylase [Pirellulales bacterium]
MPGKANSSAKQAVQQKLEDLYLAGVTHLPKRRDGKPAASAPGPRPEAKLAVKAVVPAVAVACPPAASRQDRQVQLDVLRQQVAGCTRCEELARTRTQTVFGVGNPQARLCFFGEAPGADEDRQGEPFVGRAGQLLNRIIEACGLKREEVYILNAIKCRPPENRTPLPKEVANCRGYLDGQLEIIRPEFICCLGSVAAQTLLETDISIGRLRGKFHECRGSQVLCTYHPAYLLRNPAAKKDVWEDMKMLLAKMGLEVPVSKAQG